MLVHKTGAANQKTWLTGPTNLRINIGGTVRCQRILAERLTIRAKYFLGSN